MIVRLHHFAVAISILSCAAACVQIGGTQERRLVDLNDGPPESRLRVAKTYATEEQLERLRARAKEQFPGLTQQHLSTLSLGWQHMRLADGEHVVLVVTFMPNDNSVDAKAVADYVAGTVLDDVRPQLQGAADPAR